MVKITKAISVVILLVMIGFASNNIYQIINYTINFEEISEELCKNKDNDITQCNGICYLADQILEVKKPNDDFTMDYLSSNQINLSFLFYFFVENEGLIFSDFKEKPDFALVSTELITGINDQLAPPPKSFFS